MSSSEPLPTEARLRCWGVLQRAAFPRPLLSAGLGSETQEPAGSLPWSTLREEQLEDAAVNLLESGLAAIESSPATWALSGDGSSEETPRVEPLSWGKSWGKEDTEASSAQADQSCQSHPDTPTSPLPEEPWKARLHLGALTMRAVTQNLIQDEVPLSNHPLPITRLKLSVIR